MFVSDNLLDESLFDKARLNKWKENILPVRLNGEWPKNTWFQNRIKYIAVQQLKEMEKRNGRK